MTGVDVTSAVDSGLFHGPAYMARGSAGNTGCVIRSGDAIEEILLGTLHRGIGGRRVVVSPERLASLAPETIAAVEARGFALSAFEVEVIHGAGAAPDRSLQEAA